MSRLVKGFYTSPGTGAASLFGDFCDVGETSPDGLHHSGPHLSLLFCGTSESAVSCFTCKPLRMKTGYQPNWGNISELLVRLERLFVKLWSGVWNKNEIPDAFRFA